MLDPEAKLKAILLMGIRMRLKGTNEIDWVVDPVQPGIESKFVAFGQGGAGDAIQIAHATSTSKPSRAVLKNLFQGRKGRLQIKLLVAVTHDDQAYLFGPDPDADILELAEASAENYLNAVLLEPNGVFAYRRAVALRRAYQSTEMPGFTNNGLFASHYLRTSTESHPKWAEFSEEAKTLKNLRHMELIKGLGFEVTGSPSNTIILKAKGQDKRVVAVLLDQNESFDAKSNRFQASPVEWGLGMATEQGAPWLIAIRDAQIRLYPAKDGVGVGQKSQVETYFEVDLLTLDEKKAALLPLIFSAEALAEDGTVDEFLKNSQKFASELGIRLRERVYESIVPVLSKEIANQLRTKGHQLDSAGLQLSYELTLRILFRMLFQAYAEDRGLLPAGRNERFDKNSMKSWADDFLQMDEVPGDGDSSTLWYDLMQVWDAIDQGSSEMQIPAYNGGLFGIDPELHPAGYLIRSLSIPDRVMKPALKALLIDDHTEDGVAGKVDFRSLSVREFGTIYEGLLESSLSVAEQDLTVDKKGAWVPVKEGETVLASVNEVYFHSASGERKATGSYYTPSFVVDHLIERSVEPALKAHLAKVKIKIDAGDQSGAYRDFFDFRVADLAMGSAHFLVAAIDKIEAVMRSFLIQDGNRIDGVEAELMRLENAAKFALGEDEAAYAEIERSSLLRRQIARRCIYGLDINPLAVELSRLAIWIHTFVPGLPMSSLEHGLVCANSLTGIGSVEEGLNALIPEREKVGTSLFDGVVEESLTKAKDLLIDLANADEADKAGAKRAAVIAVEARQAAAKSKLIFDLAVANRNGVISTGAVMTEEGLVDLASNQQVQDLIEAIAPAHMPYLFPEVFLREDPGFDAVIGNPPWEKIKVEEQIWWGLQLPGLRGLPQGLKIRELKKLRDSRPDLELQFQKDLESADLLRASLLKGPFPGIGSGGDPNLYQIFSWRNWQLLRENGDAGLVLPRGAFTSSGLRHWRAEILKRGSFTSLIFGINKRNWIFERIHGQTEVVFANFSKDGAGNLSYSQRFKDRSGFLNGRDEQHVTSAAKLADLTDNLTIPVLPSPGSEAVFQKLNRFAKVMNLPPELKFAPANEMHGTKQKEMFTFSTSQPNDSLPVWSGASFHLWDENFGAPYAWANWEEVLSFLRQKHERATALRSSVHFGKNPKGLPIDRARIVFRDTASGTNSRTVIACIAPPGRVLIHRAPYLVFQNGGPRAEAFIVGVMSSIVFDWIARRWVEGTFSFEILNRLPMPASAFDTNIGHEIIEIAANLSNKTYETDVWFSETGATKMDKYNHEELLGKLDGLVAAAYGLDANDLGEIFQTFHEGWSDIGRQSVAIAELLGRV